MLIRRISIVLAVSLLLALPLAALAGGTEFTMRFNSAVDVAGAKLKAGEYRIVVQDDATKATVVFYDGRREVARADGVWTSLDITPTRNCVTTRKNEQGNTILGRILLRGNSKAVELGGMNVEVKK